MTIFLSLILAKIISATSQPTLTAASFTVANAVTRAVPNLNWTHVYYATGGYAGAIVQVFSLIFFALTIWKFKAITKLVTRIAG